MQTPTPYQLRQGVGKFTQPSISGLGTNPDRTCFAVGSQELTFISQTCGVNLGNHEVQSLV